MRTIKDIQEEAISDMDIDVLDKVALIHHITQAYLIGKAEGLNKSLEILRAKPNKSK